MIKCAVIGTNFITDRFIEVVKQLNNIELVGVYSRTMDRAKEYANMHGASLVFDKLEDLANSEEVDLVYIASPNSFHFSHSMQMLQKGKHVLCEKPIASNSRELALMLQTAEENNVILLEAMRTVFDPGFLEIANNLYKLGTIRRATFQYCKYSSRYDNFKKGIIENAFDPIYSNGALTDIGVYCIHSLVKLFGLPNGINAMGILLENGIDGAGTIIADYGYMQAELLYSKIAVSYIQSEIQGEKATMLIDEIVSPKELVILYRDGQEERISMENKNKNNMYYEVEEMVRLIENSEHAQDHNQYSIMEINLLDEARKQIGIVFPADKE
ncbi:MAG: dehydrogenase [Clostridiales bacterium]|nr:dehydrogenase [Clostridiales bacterium]